MTLPPPCALTRASARSAPALPLLLVLLASLFLPAVARADFPVADTWFETDHDFDGDVCTTDVSPICQATLDGETMNCKTTLADESAVLGAKATMIRNQSDASSTDICDGYDYCMFGALKTGASTEVTFFCGFDGGDLETMVLWGTNDKDELFLHHTQNGDFDMEEHAGVAAVTGQVLAAAEDDIVHGSRHSSTAYTDNLKGDAGDDVIDAHAGDDVITAGLGDDIIWAGAGDDTAWLVAGNNQASMEDGDDTVHGGAGDDYVHLGDGLNTAHLGDGADVACGGEDDDEINGQGQVDKLWGGNDGAPDVINGGVGADLCGGGGTTSLTGCTGTPLTSAPTECPAEHNPVSE